jgi:outer membrane protein assembly factor BamB
MRSARIAAAVFVGLITLAACSGKTKSKDNVAIPKELTEIVTKNNFERVWATSIDTDNAERGEHLTPVAIGDRIFIAGQNEVRALQRSSGKTIWNKKTEARISGGPGTDGKRVVVGTLDGEVMAFDATDGELLWTSEVTSEVLAAPSLGEKIVIICSNDGRVSGLDLANGKRIWQLDRDVPLLTLRGTGTAIIDGDAAFIPGDSGKVIAVNVADGALRWEQAINVSNGRNELERVADIDGGAVVANGDLFVAGYNGQTSAVTISSGSTLWTYQGPSVVGLIVDERRVYLTDSESQVIALDRRSGAEIWKQDALLNRFVTKPVVLGANLVVADFEGYLHALDIDTGAQVGRTQLASQAFSAAPTISQDLLIAQSSSGAVAAYRIR